MEICTAMSQNRLELYLNFPTVICCCKESTLVVHSHLIDLLTVEVVSVERTGRGALHNARGMLTL
jgi:hypothetical protein